MGTENRAVARPQRPQEIVRIRVRRRHRTWMYAMILATVGWGVWWLSLFARRFFPALFPGFTVTCWVACVPAAAGLLLAVFTIRARKIWVLLAAVPICSNLFLLALPWVLDRDMLDPQDTSIPASPGPTQTDAFD